MEIKPSFLDLAAGYECLFNIGTRAKVASLNFYGGVAPARFMMAVFDHFKQVPVKLKCHPFTEFININHSIFLFENCKRAGLYAS
jgi:hypothetical protein